MQLYYDNIDDFNLFIADDLILFIADDFILFIADDFIHMYSVLIHKLI